MKIDFGCGPNKKEGFIGADAIPFDNVDVVLNLGTDPWPWLDGSVEEGHASHFVEHLNAQERCHFVNELYRVLQPGGKCTVIIPHWGSCRAYGDPTHQWPPVSEFWFYYLSKDWRLTNAPHTDKANWPHGFDCDFEATWGYALHQEVANWNQERQNYATTFHKEAIQDMICTLTKPTPATT